MKFTTKIDIPIYRNDPDNLRCLGACYNMVLNHYFGEKLSWDELDEMLLFEDKKESWSLVAYLNLAKKGLEIINIENFDYSKYFKEGEQYLKSAFGEETTKHLIEKSNLPFVRPQIKKFLDLCKHETRKPKIEDIDNFLETGHVIIAGINSSALVDKEGHTGHFVLLIGKTQDGKYLLNDSGGGEAMAQERLLTKEKLMDVIGDSGEITAIRKV